MTDMTTRSPQSLYGKIAFDTSGEELGTIEAVYLDEATAQPKWAAILTGRVETSLVPLTGASFDDSGVTLAVDRALVRSAPHGHAAGELPEALSEAEEAELYHYYSIEYLDPNVEEPARPLEAEAESGS